MKRSDKEKILWAAFSAGAVIGASMIARRGAESAWQAWRHEAPPTDAANPDNRWSMLVLWAGLSGVCVAAARLAGRGLASKAWQKQLGHRPPRG